MGEISDMRQTIEEEVGKVGQEVKKKIFSTTWLGKETTFFVAMHVVRKRYVG
jgi:hypothetical protein